MFSGTDLFYSLFNNLAIFIVFVAGYGVLIRYTEKMPPEGRQAVLGFAFGLIAISCMHAKIPVADGVIVDQRNTFVMLSGAFGGPLSALISALMVGSYQISLGGVGGVGGVVGVGLAALAGTVFNKFRKKIDNISKAALSALVATIVILPGFLFYRDVHAGWELLKAMALPYGAAASIGIFFGQPERLAFSIRNASYFHESRVPDWLSASTNLSLNIWGGLHYSACAEDWQGVRIPTRQWLLPPS